MPRQAPDAHLPDGGDGFSNSPDDVSRSPPPRRPPTAVDLADMRVFSA